MISSAYAMDPLAVRHKGFSATSFSDLTRVARLDEEMWTELFLLNRDSLLSAADGFIDRLSTYRDALRDGDADRLRALLRAGRERKESLEES